jgi:hypothetical protein
MRKLAAAMFPDTTSLLGRFMSDPLVVVTTDPVRLEEIVQWKPR